MQNEWMAEAQCGPGFTEAPLKVQVEFCAECPVRFPCLQWGMQDPAVRTGWIDSEVVYAGFTLTQLARMSKSVRA